VAHDVLNVLVAQISLQGAGVVTVVGQLAAGMAQRVRVDFHIEASRLACMFQHRLEAPLREGRPARADEDEW